MSAATGTATAGAATAGPSGGASPAGSARGGTLTGTATLVRLVLRRDRVRLTSWLLGIVTLVVVSAASVQGLYSTDAEIAQYVALSQGNPTLVAVNGPGVGFEDPNVGVVLVNEASLWGAIACALMSIFLLVRHTRAEEEAERTDLLRSGVLGRHAQLAAAALVIATLNLAIGVVLVVSVVALGFPLGGTVAFGASIVGGGLVFLGLAAVAAQVWASARGALGGSVAALGLAYAVRAAGDVAESPLSWLSPIGWPHRTRAYAGERWSVLLLMAVVTVTLLLVAVRLSDHRDMGGGMLPQRLGRGSASRSLSGPVGLVARLQRGQVIGWSLGLFLLGTVYGAVGDEVEQMFEDNPDLEAFIEQIGSASITDSYFSYTLLLGAMMATGFVTASVLRLRSEESAGRADVLLAAPLPRARWFTSHLVVAAVGTVVLLTASGLGTGIGLAAATGDAGEIPRLLGASLVHTPAVLVLAGVAAALHGRWPRWSPAAWAGLAVVVVVGLFAELLRMPRWMRLVSPLEHSPGLPAEPFAWLPVLVLAAVAGALLTAGTLAFARRDVATS